MRPLIQIRPKQAHLYLALAIISYLLVVFFVLRQDSVRQTARALFFYANSPATAATSLNEAIFLLRQHIDPHLSSHVHASPYLVYLLFVCGEYKEHLYYVSTVLTSLLVYSLAGRIYGHYLDLESSRYKNIPVALQIPRFLGSREKWQAQAAATYLLSPSTLVSSSILCASVFAHAILAATLLLYLQKKVLLSSTLLGVCIGFDHNAAYLIIPMLIFAYSTGPSNTLSLTYAGLALASFLGSVVAMDWLSRLAIDTGDSVLLKIIRFNVFIEDSRPNIGMFWYLFMGIFDHFRLFYLLAIQFFVMVLIIVATVYFVNDPFFLSFLVYGITTIFKAYPTIGDVSLILSICAIFGFYLKSYTKHLFLWHIVLLVSHVLTAVFWYQWVYAITGNANFFFSTTLVSGLMISLIVYEIMSAFERRKYDLKHGIFVSKGNQSIQRRL